MQAIDSNQLITLLNMYELRLNQFTDITTLAQNAWGTTDSDMINHRIVTAGDLRKTTTNFYTGMTGSLGTNQCVNYGTPNTYLYGKTYPDHNDNNSTWPKMYYTSQSWGGVSPTHYGMVNVYVYCPWYRIRNFYLSPLGQFFAVSVWNGNNSSPRGEKNTYIIDRKAFGSFTDSHTSGSTGFGYTALSAIDYNYSTGYALIASCPWYDVIPSLSGVSPIYLNINVGTHDGNRWWDTSTSKGTTCINTLKGTSDYLIFNTRNPVYMDGYRFILIHEPVRLSASSGNCGTANVYINVSRP